MKRPLSVYLLVLSGNVDQAVDVAAKRYRGCSVITLSKKELREGGWRRQLKVLRGLEGEAFMVFTESLEALQEPLLLKLTIMLHRCKETVIVDSQGRLQIYPKGAAWKLLAEVAVSIVADAFVFGVTWIGLQLLRLRTKMRPAPERAPTGTDVVFLYPLPIGQVEAGGANTHITGFLSGLSRCSAPCRIFSGVPLLTKSFPVHEVSYRRRFYLFRESLSLSYNAYFSKEVEKELDSIPSFIYQRHGRYVVAGALLSRALRRPLVLEYNGSEVWISRHWDPARFRPWLRLCEEISLSAASLITVVSESLRDELIQAGIQERKILVNPNAVDPDVFHSDCGGTEVRERLGFSPHQIVVGFIGSFSYWHGIGVLRQAIELLMAKQENTEQIRFVLIGDGPLRPEIREALDPYCERGVVVFTGRIAHEQAPSYLDATDILASPHVPNSDGTPFFGSPTKLFEYMAMGKAIVASNLNQLAQVLTDQDSAWLVEPGNATQLAEAILMLSTDAKLRRYLGDNARRSALNHHTWQQNAARVLARIAETKASSAVLEPVQAA